MPGRVALHRDDAPTRLVGREPLRFAFSTVEDQRDSLGAHRADRDSALLYSFSATEDFSFCSSKSVLATSCFGSVR